ncbi:glycosyltransferase, partial [Microbacterium sp.]|uniref:glycosyltransferase n=1 Tax=Microbacterium sp. TaxID=51671 RepID=UPI002897E66D
MVSVIIAAHNEEAVIGGCLDALQRQGVPGLQIIVSANGCTDATAAVAAAHGATVIDRAEPGKAGALNAADRIAAGYPRVYL